MASAASPWCATRSAAPGPNLITSAESTSQRNIRPQKTESMNGATRISKTPAAKTQAFQGVGGGSIDGIIMARNSWRSKRARMRS